MFTDEISEAAQPVFHMAIIILAAAIVLGGILIYFIIRGISKPLSELVSSAKSISGGDLTQKSKSVQKTNSVSSVQALMKWPNR